jgi:hypothetical protein
MWGIGLYFSGEEKNASSQEEVLLFDLDIERSTTPKKFVEI